MPRNKANEVKVGVFVAAGLAILALFIVSLTGIGFSTARVGYHVRFHNVAGLENGSVVALGGMKVGRVESIGIAKENPSMMEAYILVDKGTPIRKDSRAEVTSVGITGSMYLSITLGSPDSPLLKPGAVIRGVEAASFQEVINRANQTATKVNAILTTVGETVEDISVNAKATVKEVRAQIARVLTSADRAMRRVENVLSERNEKNINRFLTSISRVADRLNENVGPVVKELHLTLRKARGSLDRIDAASGAYTKLAGNASTFVDDLRERLTEVDRVLMRMDRLGADLDKTVAGGGEAIEKLRLALQAEIRTLREDIQRQIAATGTVMREEVRGVGGQARTSIRKGGENLADTLKAIENVSNRVRDFFDENQTELRSVIVNFNSASKRVNDVLVELSGGEGKNNVQGAVKELRLTLQRAHSLMSQLDEIVSSQREDVRIIIRDLRDTADNLDEFTTTLREQPAAVIFKPPVQPREFK